MANNKLLAETHVSVARVLGMCMDALSTEVVGRLK